MFLLKVSMAQTMPKITTTQSSDGKRMTVEVRQGGGGRMKYYNVPEDERVMLRGLTKCGKPKSLSNTHKNTHTQIQLE